MKSKWQIWREAKWQGVVGERGGDGPLHGEIPLEGDEEDDDVTPAWQIRWNILIEEMNQNSLELTITERPRKKPLSQESQFFYDNYS